LTAQKPQDKDNAMSAPNRKIWRDGELIDWNDATVHILSHSLQRGSLAFDYMSVHETARGLAIFRLEPHIDRLVDTCRLTGLPLVYSRQELIDACALAVRENPGATSLKISALLPSLEVEIVPQDQTVSVVIAAYESAADIIDRNEGEYRRRTELSLRVEREISNRRDDIIPPQAKVAANYTSPMIAKWQARKDGYDDVILLDTNGFIAEAPTANIFVVDSTGNLSTPRASQVLHGITRATFIELAPTMGIACRERDISVDEMMAAPEVFLSGTSAGLIPVIKVDDQTIGNGALGAVSARLKQRLQKITAGDDADFDHWLHYVDS